MYWPDIPAKAGIYYQWIPDQVGDDQNPDGVRHDRTRPYPDFSRPMRSRTELL
jgi:hypothetical protein